ncbi:MAG: polysaccharide deacetylase family protein [Clostridia bacterium]|nr:polysaccharide deacetylase family protein [Clostridia bacterium]
MALCCGLFVLCGALSATAFRRQAAATAAVPDSWGLSFPEEGQPPVGNATPELLASYDACFLGDVGKPVIYLTFDAGFENGCTAPILDTLAAEGVPAAFFLVGNYIADQPDLVRRMVAEGHLVGNHTFSHPDMSRIADPAAFEKELADLEALYLETVGEPMPKVYRPPQGKFSLQNLETAKALGYQTVFWSLAYVDWYTDNQPTREQAMAKLLPRIHNGAILLLHSTSTTNAEILGELIAAYRQMGYEFGDLKDLLSPGRTGD